MTLRTQLRRREEGIGEIQRIAVPKALVRHLPPKLSHSDVCDGLGQLVVFEHSRHVQIFEDDDRGPRRGRLGFRGNLRGRFV